MATITWLGHATFKLVCDDGRVIFVDPWIDGNPLCPIGLRDVERCDMIAITHGHFDHVGSLPELNKRFHPVIVANYDLCAAIKQVYGDGKLEGMNTGGTVNFDGINVSLTRAYHSSAMDTPNGLVYGGMPNGLVFTIAGHATVYHAGDTDVFSDMALIKRLFSPEICILPIGDRFTMGAAGAAIAAEYLHPKVILPSHYGTFPMLAPDAEAFRAALPETLRATLCNPRPGKELRWIANAAAM